MSELRSAKEEEIFVLPKTLVHCLFLLFIITGKRTSTSLLTGFMKNKNYFWNNKA